MKNFYSYFIKVSSLDPVQLTAAEWKKTLTQYKKQHQETTATMGDVEAHVFKIDGLTVMLLRHYYHAG